MASAVQICNMALSHLGSEARVTAISPPDGSVEAGHCQTFFAQVRSELLEPGAWEFALVRVALAETEDNDSDVWEFSYALPSDCIRAIRVLKAGATSDNDGALFEREGQVIYTNEEDAVLVYVRDVTDTTKYPPMFTSAFSMLLASYLAGPIIKGLEGIKVGDAWRERAGRAAEMAAVASANATMETNDYPGTLPAERA